MDLKLILENTAARFADKTAIVCGERHITFAHVAKESNLVANALIKMGVKKGDRVVMMLSSSPEFVSIFFGIIKAGGIAVPLDTRYVTGEVSRLFEDCSPEIFIIENPPLESLLPNLIGMDSFKSVKHIITVNYEQDKRFNSYQELLAGSSPTSVKVKNRPDDIAIISYTGGPTLKPHGVMLSHRSVYTEVVNSAATFEQTENDVMMAFALPMYHQFGLTAVMLASIYKGNTLVIVPGTGRSIDSFMEAVARERGTVYCGVPYIYSLMINVARREGIRHDLSSLRLLVSGGAPLEPVVVNEFKQYYGFDIHDVYGQTESVCHVTCMPVHGAVKLSSSGKTLPCWEMRIFDNNDNEAPPGCEGEIVLRGPFMTGFYKNPEDTAKVIRRGWLHTGDTGYMDEEGYLFITARQRRMLILKGQNIFPGDIEEVLNAHPKIAEARVIGVPDIVRGETVKALVRLKAGSTATEQEIRQYCQGRLADYKLPREVAFVAAMPAVIPLWRRLPSMEAVDLRLEGID